MSSATDCRPLVLLSSLAPGGAESVTVSFLRRLKHSGRDVPLCTVTSQPDGPLARDVRLAGVTRHDLGASRLADAGALARLSALIRRERFDVVHAHGQDATILAALACAMHRIPLVATRHVLEEPLRGWRHRVRARGMVASLRQARAVVAVSRAAAVALEPTGIPRDRIRVIHNGIELERFAVNDAYMGHRIRTDWGFSTDDPLVLVPAVMRDGKGHHLLIDSLPRIIAHVPRARLLLAGTGPLEPALRERARVYGASVVFLGHRTDIPALLNAADLVVLASQSEALPTVLMEAAAAGRPVVSTRVGGTDEVVVDRKTGLLVSPADPAGLATAVVTLLQNRELAGTLGAAARAEADARFGIDLQVDRTCELWREIAASHAA
jgi:glycosyltransferase involved in cell wall biosynthesis